MAHDQFFFFLAASLGSVCYIHDELTEYRLHDGNLFGPGKRTQPGFVDRWRYRLEDRSGTYTDFSHAAETNVELLSRLSRLTTLSPLLRERAGAATTSWQARVALYDDRAQLCANTLPGRIAAFIRLCRRGAYGETAFWTFGRKAMAKDDGARIMTPSSTACPPM